VAAGGYEARGVMPRLAARGVIGGWLSLRSRRKLSISLDNIPIQPAIVAWRLSSCNGVAYGSASILAA